MGDARRQLSLASCRGVRYEINGRFLLTAVVALSPTATSNSPGPWSEAIGKFRHALDGRLHSDTLVDNDPANPGRVTLVDHAAMFKLAPSFAFVGLTVLA